jgi:hypothetical protein
LKDERKDVASTGGREHPKPKCFVIQAFDGGTFDRRYGETFQVALERAGAIPQRADEILGLSPVVEKIEAAIEGAQLCLAEVSLDNPNVWLELGYALALKRRVVIICDKARRDRLPFDVQHRPVIFYRSDSSSGFKELENSIERWVKKEIENIKHFDAVPMIVPGSPASKSLRNEEATLLAILLIRNTKESETSAWFMKENMQARGFDDFATALALASLVRSGYVNQRISFERVNFDEEETKWYSLTEEGVAWLVEHQGDLKVPAPSNRSSPSAYGSAPKISDDDDIPF